MRIRGAGRLRKHWHVLLIVPLVVIVMTWPTFPRIFDADEFWLHATHRDKWIPFWLAWHVESVLAGQAQLYYTDAMFHPQGVSLAFQHHELPHTILFLALRNILPADDAFNLIYLLFRCFNAFCAYLLVHYLIRDKWIALFGAVVISVTAAHPLVTPVADINLFGTLPLTIYFYHRAVFENRWRFAAMAGICAGVTALIGEYTFVFTLISVGIFTVFLAWRRWRKPVFWLQFLLFVVLAGSLGLLRFYPLIFDTALLNEGRTKYKGLTFAADILDFFVHSPNPVTRDFLYSVFNVPPDSSHSNGYLGYINLVLLGCAIFYKPWRRRLTPWVAMFIFFVVMRMGNYLIYNGFHYPHVTLPEALMDEWFPLIFGNIAGARHYHIGVIYPLAVLSSFGLAILTRTSPKTLRIVGALAACIVVAVEFYAPREGKILERETTEYAKWLRAIPEKPIKIIDLPQFEFHRHYFLYTQSITGFPTAFGFQHRLRPIIQTNLERNFLLRNWYINRSVHCLPRNEQAFTTALEQLLADGFSHIVVHNWLYGDEFIMHSFKNIPAAYDDGFVSIYRLSDMRLSCQNQAAELPRFMRFAQSKSAMPGRGSAILSYSPNRPIDPDLFDYLGSLFSDWASLLHLYQEDGELISQYAGKRYDDLDAFANDNQVVYLLYNSHETDANLLKDDASLAGFKLCQRETHDDGAVIELHVSREFSCEIVTASSSPQVQYDNGIRLENIEAVADQDALDLQFWWSGLPDEAHSLSLQVFDVTGTKALGLDAVIGNVTLNRHRINISSLPPGDYRVMLILYNFETGASISGTVSGDGRRIDRALEVATIHRN